MTLLTLSTKESRTDPHRAPAIYLFLDLSSSGISQLKLVEERIDLRKSRLTLLSSDLK
jgi:hypothetical protein